MGTTQTVFGGLIVVVLAAIGSYYAWRSLRTLRSLREAAEMPPDEFRYLRNQAWRRLAGSALMFLVAGLFVGLLALEGPAAALTATGDELQAQNQPRGLDADEKDFVRLYGWQTVILLLVLMAIIGLAGYEFFAIRRYSVRHMRRIQEERRAMIARETARLRAGRNGHN